ncbi:MAG TPA: IPT/TIG domain-containing protein, partial [Longimicrobium sp.]|nr:IPT/TIG domain-containing protein [Longimicrobium sp.]
GAQVDIFGTELGSANRVTFNAVDAQFTVVSNTQVRAFVPGFVGSGPIRVHTPLGTAVSATNFFAGSGLPTLTSFTPTSGRPGDIVTLNGTDLNLATGVRIGTFRIQVISRPSNQQITFTLPSGVMTGPIILESAAGEVQGGVFTVLPPLTTTVSGITPTQGSVGIGVTISGTSLDRVTGGSFAPGIPVQLNPTGDGRLATMVPPGAVTGPITLNTPTGPVFTPPFTVLTDATPIVTVLSPGGGQTFNPGQVIDVTWNVTDDGVIVSQEIRYSANGGATFQTLVPGLPGATRTLAVQLPAQATDSAVIAVRATDNTGKTGEGRSGTFRVGAPADARPQVTVLSPNGGEQLVAGQVTRISWNSSDDRGLVSHDVRVSTNGGQTFQDIALGLAGNARETFWAVPNQPTTTALVMVTARDTAGQTGEDRSNAFFRIISLVPPQVQGVAPGEGPLAGGTTVTVTGTGFKPGCRARFGGIDAVTTFVDATRLSAVTPRGAAAGLVAVAVVNPDGGSGTLSNAFRYLPPSGEPVTGRLVLQSVTVVDPDGDPDAGVPDEDGFDPTAGPALLAVGESATDSSEVQETALLAVETIPADPAVIAPAVSVDVGSSLAISRPLGLTDATLSALADVGGLVLVPASAAAEPPPVPRIRAGEVARFAFTAELYDAEGKPVFGRELRIITGDVPPKSTLVVAPEFVPSFGTFVATLTTTIETPPARYVLSFQGGTVLQPTLLTPIFVQPIDIELPLRKVRVFASPARQEVAPGGSATFDITLRRKNIPGVPVRPQVKNALPPGVTVTFDPVRITGRTGKMIVQTPPDI